MERRTRHTPLSARASLELHRHPLDRAEEDPTRRAEDAPTHEIPFQWDPSLIETLPSLESRTIGTFSWQPLSEKKKPSTLPWRRTTKTRTPFLKRLPSLEFPHEQVQRSTIRVTPSHEQDAFWEEMTLLHTVGAVQTFSPAPDGSLHIHARESLMHLPDQRSLLFHRLPDGQIHTYDTLRYAPFSLQALPDGKTWMTVPKNPPHECLSFLLYPDGQAHGFDHSELFTSWVTTVGSDGYVYGFTKPSNSPIQTRDILRVSLSDPTDAAILRTPFRHSYGYAWLRFDAEGNAYTNDPTVPANATGSILRFHAEHQTIEHIDPECRAISGAHPIAFTQNGSMLSTHREYGYAFQCPSGETYQLTFPTKTDRIERILVGADNSLYGKFRPQQPFLTRIPGRSNLSADRPPPNSAAPPRRMF